MNNKKYFLFAIITLGVLVFFKISYSDKAQLKNIIDVTSSVKNSSENKPAVARSPTAKSLTRTLSSKSSSPDYVDLEARLEAMQSRRPEQHFDKVAVEAAVQRQITWEPAKIIPKHLPLELGEFTDGRQFIQLDSLKIETLMPGDTFKINISDTRRDYSITVDNVEKYDARSITWFGHIDGNDGQMYSVSFSRGDKLTVGGIDTPEGHYELQAHGNDGWIASSKLLFKVNPEVTDEVYPNDIATNKKVAIDKEPL